jgi:hypothetical protein
LLVTKLLNRSPTCGFHAIVGISTNCTCEASDRSSPNKLKPVVSRMLWPWCYGQASRLVRLKVIHATYCAS